MSNIISFVEAPLNMVKINSFFTQIQYKLPVGVSQPKYLLSTHAIGKVWIYRLLFVCVCLFVRLRISSARIKLAASNFARWFMGVLGRESPILGNFGPPEAQNQMNRPPTRK